MVFVTSDPHGHRVELVAGLQRAGLVDESARWSGGQQKLWVLGDLLDRGPDGLGVIDLVRRLQVEAADAGGEVGALLGNHEVLAMGMLTFGAVPEAASADPRRLGVALTWERNGGRRADQDGLTGERLEWMRSLPALHVEGDHLFLHADTASYLDYAATSGASVEEVNAAVTADLCSEDLDDWGRLWHRMTSRYEFCSPGGDAAVRQVTGAFGVRRLVHGHSIIGELMEVAAHRVTSALLYSDNRVLAIDGGIYAGGPCLVVDLDAWPDDRA